MQMNRKGVSCMFDACVFMVIILLAISFILSDVGRPPVPEGTDEVMDTISSVRMGMDALSESEAGDILPLTDMLAYAVVTGDQGPLDLVSMIMMERFPGHEYTVDVWFEGMHTSAGEEGGNILSSSDRSFKVSVGGDVRVRICLFE